MTIPLVALAQEPEVRLATETGRTQFRIGEPIKLTLSFTAETGDYSAETLSSGLGSSYDEVLYAPTPGIFNWAQQYMGGRRPMEDVSSMSKLSSTPTVIRLTLNNFIRFDAPGTYAIRFRSTRVIEGSRNSGNPSKELTTNEIKLTINEMSEADDAAETKRLSTAIEAAGSDWQKQNSLVEQLSYLTGRASTLEKARLFLAQMSGQSKVQGDVRLGLFIARDRKLVSKLLYDAFRDPTREVQFELVVTLAMIRAMSQYSDDTSYTDADYSRVENELLSELADSLTQRKGIQRGAAAITILQKLPRENPPAALLAKIRTIIVADFDTYSLYSREYLAANYWDVIKDASLVPALVRMMGDTSGPPYVNAASTALQRLIELDPQKAKPFVVAMIKSDKLYPDGMIDGLSEETLPDADTALLAQLNQHSAAHESVQFRKSALLVARYASPDIYYPLLNLYRQSSSGWQRDAKGIVLGYFLKHNPEQGMTMLKDEAARSGDMASSLFHDATRYTFPTEAANYFESQLQSDDPMAASTAAYILSSSGAEKHKAMIFSRLDKWVATWKPKIKALEDVRYGRNPEVNLQVELISALVLGHNWKLTDDEKRELRSKCLIEACKPYVREQPSK